MATAFSVLDQTFEVKHFPRLHAMHKANPGNLERQLMSIADAWHGGDISSAATAFESDLQHG